MVNGCFERTYGRDDRMEASRGRPGSRRGMAAASLAPFPSPGKVLIQGESSVSTPRQRRCSPVFYGLVLVQAVHVTTKEPACDIDSSPRRWPREPHWPCSPAPPWRRRRPGRWCPASTRPPRPLTTSPRVPPPTPGPSASSRGRRGRGLANLRRALERHAMAAGPDDEHRPPGRAPARRLRERPGRRLGRRQHEQPQRRKPRHPRRALERHGVDHRADAGRGQRRQAGIAV